MLWNNRGQIFLLIEILVVAAIIIGVGLYVSHQYFGSKGDEQEEIATPIERAQSVDCINNLRQIRYAIDIRHQTTGQIPASIEDLAAEGISGRITKCPVSEKDYVYDPSEARVSCATPGHEQY